jgi:hypothetical protein
MVGILVHGNNHFILGGPAPDGAEAAALARHWSIIQIGKEKSLRFGDWEIRTKEFREDLEWAVVTAGGDGDISSGVQQMLRELAARGVEIHDYSKEPRPASNT